MRMPLIATVLLAGCSCSKEPPPPQKVIIEIKSDNPVLEAMGEASKARAEKAKENAEYADRASAEFDRFMKEEDALGNDYLKHTESISAYHAIYREYRDSGDSRTFYERVKGKKITEFAPAK